MDAAGAERRISEGSELPTVDVRCGDEMGGKQRGRNC